MRGTLDILGKGHWLLVHKVTIPHPTDYGYTKEVYVLTDSGKRKLKRLKEERNLL